MSETYIITLQVNGEDNASGPLNNVGGVLGNIGEIAGGILGAALFQRIADGIWSMGQQALESYANFERLGFSLNALVAREMVSASAVTTHGTAVRQATQAEIERAGWLTQQIALEEKSASGLDAGSDAYLKAEQKINKMRGELSGLTIDENGNITTTTTATERTMSMADALDKAGVKTQELIKWTTDLGIHSPFNPEQIAQAFQLAMSFGFTSESAKRMVQDIVDYGAATGKSDETVQRMIMSLGQMNIAGKMSGREIRELALAGLPVESILMNALHVTKAELDDMMKNGALPASKAFEILAQSIEQDFGGAAKRQSGTVTGLLTSFEGLKNIDLRLLFTGAITAAQPYLSKLVDLMGDPKFQEGLTNFGAQVGGMIGPALEFMVRAIGDLIPRIQQLGAWLGTNLGPALAFVTAHWKEFAGALVGVGVYLAGTTIMPILTAIGVAIAAINWPIVLIVGALALLGAAWAGNWGGIQEKTAALWAWLQPILQELWNWLATNVPIAIKKLSDFWTGTLSPAIQNAWNAIQPVLQNLWNWLSTNIPQAIQTLSNFWNTVLYPALLYVWTLLEISVFPLFQAIGNFMGAEFKLVTTVVAGVWQNVLAPALGKAWDWLVKLYDQIAAALGPKLEWLHINILTPFGDFLKGVFTGALGGVLKFFQDITKALGDMANGMNNIKLPKWMTPGSPTPWENGLRGVFDAMGDINNLGMPKMEASFAASAGYSGRSAAGGPGGSGGPLTVNIYSAINTADTAKVRQVLTPILADINRRTLK